MLPSGWVAAASFARGNCFLCREMGVAELCRRAGCGSLSWSYVFGGRRALGYLGLHSRCSGVLISWHPSLPGPLGAPHFSTRFSGSELSPAPGSYMTIS